MLIFAGAVRIWQLVVIEALFGAAQAFFQPAYTGLLPQTVPEELIQDARALTELDRTTSRSLVGPALATVLVLGVGAGEAFAFDAATFVLSALLLARVQPAAARASRRAASVGPARAARRLARGRARAPGCGSRSPSSRARCCASTRSGTRWRRSIARDVYGGAGVFGVLESVAGRRRGAAARCRRRWRPRRPLRAGLLLVLSWPVQDVAFALGAPLALVLVIAVATGLRLLAVR